jgi:hypothetical protein
MVLLLRTRLRRPEDSHFTSEGEALQVRSLWATVKHGWRYIHSQTRRQASSLTRAGLSVHMNQVHKENLTHVENAIGGRQGLDIEIFGMEGVPAEILDSHNQQVTQKHFAEEAERARLTGNPVRGQYTNGQAPPNKRKKVNETLEEIEERANKFRHDRQNGILPAPPVEVAPQNPVRLPAPSDRRRVLTVLDTSSSSPLRRAPRRLPRCPSLPSPARPALPHKRRHTSATRQHPRPTRRAAAATRLRRAASIRTERLRSRCDTRLGGRPHRVRCERSSTGR